MVLSQGVIVVLFCFLFHCDCLEINVSDSLETYISPQQYELVTKMAEVANSGLIRAVLSRPCQISVNFEKEKIDIQPPPEKEVINGVKNQILGRLCLVHQGSDLTKPVFLNMFDSLQYLKQEEPSQYFMNRAYYAMKNDRTFYIWIGVIPEESLTLVRIPWVICHKETKWTHYYKVLALSALLHHPSSPEKVMYVDSDTFIRFDSQYKPYYAVEKNFEDPAVFLIGNTGGSLERRTARLMNSAHLGVKNNNEAKKFLALWWQSHCGDKDQLALYVTLLAYFSSVSANFTFSVENLKLYDYDKAKQGRKAYYHVASHIQEITNGDGCQSSTRKPTLPELGFYYEPRLMAESPICGAVVTSSERNSYCHCHIKSGIKKCKGICRGKYWPPPYHKAPLGKGEEPEFNSTWYI